MNGSRNTPAPAAHAGPADSDAGSDANHRKTGGGMLKKLKSRRSQTEKWPAVTEDELRALGSSITPDHVLGLRAITEGELWEYIRFLNSKYTAKQQAKHVDATDQTIKMSQRF